MRSWTRSCSPSWTTFSSVSKQQARAELTRVNREIRRLRTELAELEERRAKLGSDLGE
jgi:hypothetical protein